LNTAATASNRQKQSRRVTAQCPTDAVAAAELAVEITLAQAANGPRSKPAERPLFETCPEALCQSADARFVNPASSPPPPAPPPRLPRIPPAPGIQATLARLQPLHAHPLLGADARLNNDPVFRGQRDSFGDHALEPSRIDSVKPLNPFKPPPMESQRLFACCRSPPTRIRAFSVPMSSDVLAASSKAS